MNSDFEWDVIEFRLEDYYSDDTDENLVALISGLRHSRLAYIADKDKRIRDYNIKAVNDDGSTCRQEAVPLFTVKSKTNNWMDEGDAMHMTSFDKIMKMCSKINAERVLINPSKDAILIEISDITEYIKDLDVAQNFIMAIRMHGLEGEDLFEPLLQSFDDCPVVCDVEGVRLTGTAFAHPDDEPMFITLADFRTDKETTIPVDKIKRIRVMQSR